MSLPNDIIHIEIRSGLLRGPENEAQSFYRRTNHRNLKEHETSIPVSELCRKHSVSDASIYKWKAKFGGMDVSEAERLKSLEDENTKLKQLLADAMFDNIALKIFWERSGDARSQAEGCRSVDETLSNERTAGV